MLWRLCERKDSTKSFVRPEFETRLGTSTMALICSMTKPMYGIVKMVIMDSGLCVLKFLLVCTIYESVVVQW